jgi:hypothetical protein
MLNGLFMRMTNDALRRGLPKQGFRLIHHPFPLRTSTTAAPLVAWLSRAAVYVGLCAFTLLPLFLVSIPPLVDYPNHLARMSILLRAGEDPLLTANYQPHWRLLPNLAMDLIVPPLAHLLSLESAGWLFVAATMILLILGTSVLHRVLHGRVGLWPLCSLLFLYNAVLSWGFLNYLFALSITLLGFSGWIATAHWPRPIRAGIFAVFSALLLVFHLFAFGVYGLLVITFEIGNRFGGRRFDDNKAWIGAVADIGWALAQFVPAGALWLASLGNGGGGYTAMGDLSARFYGFYAPVAFSNPATKFDCLTMIFSIFFLYVAWRQRALCLAPAMRVSLVAMLVVSAFMPEWLSGSWAAQIRLPVATTFVLIASLTPRLPRQDVVPVFAIAALVLLGVRVWSVAASWQETSDQFAEFRAAAQAIPGGARILTVESAMPEDWGRGSRHSWLFRRSPMIYDHLAALAVIDRAAFTPSLFTGWVPIEPVPRNRDLPRILGGTLTPAQLASRASRDAAPGPSDALGETPCCFNWPETYDVVLWIDFGQPPDALLPQLEPLSSGSFFHIYRIARGNPGGVAHLSGSSS